MRSIWFDKNHPMATYLDIRPEMSPTYICNTIEIPKEVGGGYDLIVYDPPHLNMGANSFLGKRYGHFTTKEILESIQGTAKEAYRVSKQKALMAFKWNDHDIKLKRVLNLMPQWEPLFGNLVGDSVRSKTYWVMLLRRDNMG